jgi:hypothetical protein
MFKILEDYNKFCILYPFNFTCIRTNNNIIKCLFSLRTGEAGSSDSFSFTQFKKRNKFILEKFKYKDILNNNHDLIIGKIYIFNKSNLSIYSTEINNLIKFKYNIIYNYESYLNLIFKEELDLTIKYSSLIIDLLNN